MPVTDAGALLLPATSVQIPDADCPLPSADSTTFGEHLETPDPVKLSVPANDTVTSVLFHPFPLAAGVRFAIAIGAVLSILIPLAWTMHEGTTFHGHACKFGDVEA
jgi:hypothetical protein